MGITNFTGEQLLDTANLEAIKKEADLLLQNKDVAGAWQASRHIKAQLAGLSGDKVKPVLDDYRRLTANLKALALPLLGWDEVKTLITNNLSFLEEKYLPATGAGLNAWLSTQADEEKESRRVELLKLLPAASPLRANLETKSAVSQPMVASTKSAAKISQHGEMFDKDEAVELASHAQKVSEIGGAPLATEGAASVGGNIFALSGGSGDKETFLRRANALITSRLRDVRTKTDLREYLGRPFKVGGLGLGAEILDKASGLIEDEYNKLHSSEPKAPQPQAEIAKAVAAAIAEEPAKPVAPPVVKPAPEPAVPKIEPKPALKVEPVPDAVRVVRPMRAAPVNDKPRVDDIKSSPRTVSSTDELKLLTIEDWRKFASPDEAIKSIFQKIQLLGQQSVGDKVQGIKMFRASELFQHYVALGRATLAQGKKLTEALADKNINPANITQDEFFAIALLNGKLK